MKDKINSIDRIRQAWAQAAAECHKAEDDILEDWDAVNMDHTSHPHPPGHQKRQPIDIREAEKSDLTGLSKLFDEYRQFYRQKPDLQGAQAFISERLSRKDSFIFIAFPDEQPAGFVQLYPSFSSVAMQRIFILNDLYVNQKARGKGIATALIRKAEEFALEMGAVRLSLATEIANTPAQKLYEKLQWKKDEVFLHYNRTLCK